MELLKHLLFQKSYRKTNIGIFTNFAVKPSLMFKLLVKFYQDRFLSRWTVLLIDVAATLLALIVSIGIRFNFNLDEAQRVLDRYSFLMVIGIYIASYLIVGSFKGILRHTSLDDVKNVFRASLLGGSATVLLSFLAELSFGARFFPVSILTFHYALTFIALLGLRLAAKSIYIAGTQTKSDTINLIIFGCGDSGIMTKNALQQEQHGKYKIIGFSDDNSNRWGKQLQDIPIY